MAEGRLSKNKLVEDGEDVDVYFFKKWPKIMISYVIFNIT